MGGKKVNASIIAKHPPKMIKLIVIKALKIAISGFFLIRYQLISPPKRQNKEKQTLMEVNKSSVDGLKPAPISGL